MLCKTCKRAVIRVFEGEEHSANTEHGEYKEEIICLLDTLDMEGISNVWGKLTACSKYLPKDKETTV